MDMRANDMGSRWPLAVGRWPLAVGRSAHPWPTANPFRATLTRLRRNAMTALETPTTSKYPDVRNYIAGQFVDGNGARTLEVTNPADGSVISRVPLSGSEEIDRAVAAAKKAFPSWAATPIKERVQVFFRYKTLLEKNI